MTKKKMLVDYGPMALSVGEDDLDGQPLRPLALSPDDAVRFQAAIQERPRRTSRDDEAGSTLASPFELLTRTQSDPLPTHAEIAEAIEHLWVPEHQSGTREVLVHLVPSLLPGTVLRIHEHDARLQVELHVGPEQTRRFLSFTLPVLGRDLGARLRRDLCVSLHASGEDVAPLRFLWPEDTTS